MVRNSRVHDARRGESLAINYSCREASWKLQFEAQRLAEDLGHHFSGARGVDMVRAQQLLPDCHIRT
jgi:hypothetical protein